MPSVDTLTTKGALLIGALLVLLLFPAAAWAESPPLFTQIPEGRESAAGAGQLNNPRAVASDPATGHIYVSDQLNQRIDEFTAWGEFIKAWGWGVDTGAAELQTCTTASGCQAGIPGTGAGQFNFLRGGIAVDSEGNVYVGDLKNDRVEKFNSNGEFLLMFGGGVDKTTNADVCTQEDLENGDECGAGTPGTGNAEFITSESGDYIEYSPATNSIWVGDVNRIQEFGVDGTYQSQLALPLEKGTTSLSVDRQSGALFVTLTQPEKENSDAPFVYKHTASGWTQFAEVGNPGASPFPIRGFPRSVATDSAGNVYVIAEEKQVGLQNWQQVLEFSPGGTCVLCLGDEFAKSQPAEKPDAFLVGIATGFGCEVTSSDIYVTRFQGFSNQSFVDAYGPPPKSSICPPPVAAPTIVDQYTLSATSKSALVRAVINPHFWPDTSFYVEYGTEECSKGGCEAKPLPPGAPLGGAEVNVPVTASAVSITGLAPTTTYHYRFVAVSGGGGPTIGKERTFTTFPTTTPKITCPNQGFRTGLAAFLPDCRAYEMVSPVDKEGGDIAVLLNGANEQAGLFESSVDGSKLTYSSARAFGSPTSAPYTSQYIASRSSTGWASESISPPREGASIPEQRYGLDSQYMAFSGDLCQGWLFQDANPVLDSAAPAGFTDLYRRDGCGKASYAALNTTEPSTTGPVGFWPELQGHSEDGSCAVFRANGKLTPDASSELFNGRGIYQTYESCNGQTRLVSALPDGSASNLSSSAGTASGTRLDHRDQSVWHAVSRDGSRVYWTAAATPELAAGKIYVRDHADREPSAVSGNECLEEPEKACTYKISGSAIDARFLTADPEGEKALFTTSGQLREYDFANRSSSLVAGEVAGLLGTSEDLSRIYLVSKEDLAGTAKAGEPNLYLYEAAEGGGEGSFTFIATLSTLDSAPPGDFVSPVSIQPSRHVARVTADGEAVAFMSTASLTGYDNTDAASGEPDAEVYLYDASANGGAGKLVCVSCITSSARPQGRELLSFNGNAYWADAEISTWESQLYPSRALSTDGTRLFFESFDPLALRDTNGKRDVYEWQSASSAAECEEAGAELFAQQAGGCISLISSGQSPQDSEFLDASPDGSDVFFSTASSLLPQDPGLVDVYDARVEGGFPSSPPPVPPCEGESCRGPSSAPSEPSLSSSSLGGRGNVKPAKPKHHCKKGKVRRKGRCVAKKRGHRKSAHHRGGSR